MADHDKLRDAVTLVRDFFRSAGNGFGTIGLAEAGRLVVDAAASILPKTKMVEVWHVHSAADRGGIGHPSVWMPQVCLHFTEDSARDFARLLGTSTLNRCISVTGPHQQEVPA